MEQCPSTPSQNKNKKVRLCVIVQWENVSVGFINLVRVSESGLRAKCETKNDSISSLDNVN